MKGTDREDAMARALDLLPTDDPARSDPRLVRDAALVEEARATREAAADLWLAVSPLRAAPPDLLPSVMEKIGLPVVAANRRQRYFPWIAASGWAAAAVVAVSLWPQRHAQGPLPLPGAVAGQAPTKSPGAAGNPVFPVVPQAEEIRSPERQQRDELMRLRNLLADLREEQMVSAPRVMSLSAPGSIEPTPEEARERVWAVVTHALRHSLVAGRGPASAGGGQNLIFDAGLPDASAFADDETVLMHLNFPENSWQEHGLLRSDDGNYYDPAQQVLWVPDGAGFGFFGKKTPEVEIDGEVYKAASEVQDIASIERKNEAQGYVVEDPLTKKAEVFVDGVLPPEEGSKQVLKWTDAAGNSGELEVGIMSASAGLNPGMMIAQNNSVLAIPNGASPLQALAHPQLQSNSASGAQGSFMIMASLSCPSSLASFELVEVPIAAQSKKPKRVIVAGGRRRAR